MRWSDYVLQWFEGEEVEKTPATFYQNHSHMAQWVEQLTFIQKVVGSNPAGEQIFFFENQYFLYTLKFSFDNTVS